MRIAFITPAWPPANVNSGITTYVDIMTRTLAKLGHECVIIALRRYPGHDEQNRTVFYVEPRQLDLLAKLARKLRHAAYGAPIVDPREFAQPIIDAVNLANLRAPIDVIEAEESFGATIGVSAKTGIPVVIRSHGPHFLVDQEKRDRAYHRRVKEEGHGFRDASAISFTSATHGKVVTKQYGLQSIAQACFPNPVMIENDTDCWSLSSCNPKELLFVGRFDLIKGGDIIIDAFSQLAEKHHDLKLTFIGNDLGIPDEDGERIDLPSYIKNNLPETIGNRIDILGIVPRDEVNNYRRRALATVVASRYETFPYAVTECLAIGAPVVATSTPGVSEYLKDEENILFARPGDAEALAAAMEKLINDTSLAKKIGRSGYEKATLAFSPEKVVEQALAFYKTACVQDLAQRKARP